MYFEQTALKTAFEVDIIYCLNAFKRLFRWKTKLLKMQFRNVEQLAYTCIVFGHYLEYLKY